MVAVLNRSFTEEKAKEEREKERKKKSTNKQVTPHPKLGLPQGQCI